MTFNASKGISEFIFSKTTNYIGIKFRLPTADGRGALTVGDGARLRNAPVGL